MMKTTNNRNGNNGEKNMTTMTWKRSGALYQDSNETFSIYRTSSEILEKPHYSRKRHGWTLSAPGYGIGLYPTLRSAKRAAQMMSEDMERERREGQAKTDALLAKLRENAR